MYRFNREISLALFIIESGGVCVAESQNEIACENAGNVDLSCGGGGVISIIEANYGRTRPSAVICQFKYVQKTICI